MNNLKFTTVLGKFEKFNRLLSGWFEAVGLIWLLLVVFITFFDVIGGKLFLSPISGAIHMVMLSQAIAIAFAAAMTLIMGRHIKIEFFVGRLPERAREIIHTVIALLGLALFILITWRLGVHGYSLQKAGEISATARIPLYPFVYGIALASVPVCLVLLHESLTVLVRVIKK